MKTIYVSIVKSFGMYPFHLEREHVSVAQFKKRFKALKFAKGLLEIYAESVILVEIQLDENEVYVISEEDNKEYISIEPKEIKSKIKILSL